MRQSPWPRPTRTSHHNPPPLPNTQAPFMSLTHYCITPVSPNMPVPSLSRLSLPLHTYTTSDPLFTISAPHLSLPLHTYTISDPLLTISVPSLSLPLHTYTTSDPLLTISVPSLSRLPRLSLPLHTYTISDPLLTMPVPSLSRLPRLSLPLHTYTTSSFFLTTPAPLDTTPVPPTTHLYHLCPSSRHTCLYPTTQTPHIYTKLHP
ncbi:hypothetical protein Pcinc_009411 [Petrolisthes cinctipes]|uniref:Uncharacterized protein n=1 Tax=Petrolisthes cinctipes TaxID=88211 RepID=A0AAE1G6X3_PETCI|nr:hypothetical protein Pcinc_009411 [Petrolisthes cinctipes]